MHRQPPHKRLVVLRRLPGIAHLRQLLEGHLAWEAAVTQLVTPRPQGEAAAPGQRPPIAELQQLAETAEHSCMASELYDPLDELLLQVGGARGAGGGGGDVKRWEGRGVLQAGRLCMGSVKHVPLERHPCVHSWQGPTGQWHHPPACCEACTRQA
jgi:hypothetical protein